MNTSRQTAVMQGDAHTHTNRRAATRKEGTVKPTTAKLIRWAGLSAMAAGILFVVIQPLHPAETLSSVTTSRWAIVHSVTVTMCLLLLLGVTGLYARQVEEAGWLGLAGYLLFSLCWALQMPYGFAEAVILPRLANDAPGFVQSFLGLYNGSPGEMNLGALATVYTFSGFLYILGGLLFGLATLRAGILPRWAAAVLAVGAVAPLAIALVPHEFQRIAAVPMGLGLAWLGAALWSERREQAAEPVPGRGSPQLRPTGAE